MQKINLKIELLSPLAHFGEEKLSTTCLCRRQKFIVDNVQHEVPVYSGNALRGQCRRLIFDDFLKTIGCGEITLKLYHTFFSGGSLISGVSFASMDEKKELLTLIPPISVLGTAFGDTILQGKAKFGIGLPVCNELNTINSEQSKLSFVDLLSEVFYTRSDDTKSKVLKLSTEDKNVNPVQMKYDFEGLVAGTKMETSIIIENANEIEIACLHRMIELLKASEYLGGKSATGHGKIRLDTDIELNSNAYIEFISDNKEAINSYLQRLAGKLK